MGHLEFSSSVKVFEWVTSMDYGPWTSRVSVDGLMVVVEAGYDDSGWDRIVLLCESAPVKFDFPGGTYNVGEALACDECCREDTASYLSGCLGVVVN